MVSCEDYTFQYSGVLHQLQASWDLSVEANRHQLALMFRYWHQPACFLRLHSVWSHRYRPACFDRYPALQSRMDPTSYCQLAWPSLRAHRNECWMLKSHVVVRYSRGARLRYCRVHSPACRRSLHRMQIFHAFEQLEAFDMLYTQNNVGVTAGSGRNPGSGGREVRRGGGQAVERGGRRAVECGGGRAVVRGGGRAV